MSNIKDYPDCEIIYWFPVIEDNFGQERFLIEDPSETFRSGKFNKVPIIIGRTEHEFQDRTESEWVERSYSNKMAVKYFSYFEWPSRNNLKRGLQSNRTKMFFLLGK